MNNINPLMFQLPVEDETGGDEGEGVVSGGKKRRRRRKRSVPDLGRKIKRQTVNTNDDTMTTDITEDIAFVSQCASAYWYRMYMF